MVRVRAGGRHAVWPLAVAGLPQKNGSAGRPRPLVVLPALSWLGRARVDDDHDGFADSLPEGSSDPARTRVPRRRAPAGLRSDASPLLRFLDREGLTYDLTTDLSLARGDGPALGNATGVAFAGAALWLPPDLLQRLRRYVDGGGRLASFGADAFRRGVHLGRERSAPPHARRRPTSSASAPRCCTPARPRSASSRTTWACSTGSPA